MDNLYVATAAVTVKLVAEDEQEARMKLLSSTDWEDWDFDLESLDIRQVS